MIIFNTTYLVSDKMYGKWFKWLREEHIPDMLATGFFDRPQVAKVLTADVEQEGSSYSVQFHTEDVASLEAWNREYGDAFASRFAGLFGDEVLCFSSVLEIVP